MPPHRDRFDFRIQKTGPGPPNRRLRRQWELVNDYAGPANVLQLPRNRTVVLSDAIRLPNVKLTGTGVYAVRFYLRPPRSRWVLGAVEYFRVVR